MAGPARAMSPKMRTKDDIAALKAALYAIIEAGKPMGVRQVAYQAVVHRLIPKTEAEFKGTVGRLLTVMREAGELPFEWIVDETRRVRQPTLFPSLAAGLATLAEMYRRDPWPNQAAYIEVWIEKEGLVGVVEPITAQWGVPLLAVRGDASVSAMWAAAQRFPTEKPVHVLYLGDRDATGDDIPRVLEEKLARYGAPAFTFTRVALTRAQITAHHLPTRPPKASHRNAAFTGPSVELDALPPDVLRALVEAAIAQHVDLGSLERTRAAEATDRKALDRLVRRGTS